MLVIFNITSQLKPGLVNSDQHRVYRISDNSLRNFFQLIREGEECLTSNVNHDNLPLF